VHRFTDLVQCKPALYRVVLVEKVRRVGSEPGKWHIRRSGFQSEEGPQDEPRNQLMTDPVVPAPSADREEDGGDASESSPPGTADRTPWSRRDTPLRRFLRTETGSALVLLAAAVGALIWANINVTSYNEVWQTRLSIHLGQWGVSMDLRDWIDRGLMSFFFLTVGLEARREFDIGEFRDRPRIVLPVLAGLGGMIGAIGIFLAFNLGRTSVHGWGVAMSTDTAFALGVLALLGKRVPDRSRGFILTVTVVDDIVGLIVIATVYTQHVGVTPLMIAIALCVVAVVAVRLRIHYGLVYLLLGLASWVALVKSGVDPLVVGLGAGLIAYAAPAARADLERATDLFRDIREQPTAGLARAVRAGIRTALSPNERLQRRYHAMTSYFIVPLFALANAGISVDKGFLSRAYTSPITLGVTVGYMVGKPMGVGLTSALITRTTKGRLRPPVGWTTVAGGGTLAGIGFTVSLLIASIAFKGTGLREATLGVLTSAAGSAIVTWTLFHLAARLPSRLRAKALLGRSEVIVDLVDPVDLGRDHVRGPIEALVTLVEYGDFECPYCGRAEPIVRELLSEFGDLRYVWRHLPLTDVHPHARLAAEASEAAGAQGAFWPMHDLLITHQSALTPPDLLAYAEQLGLDIERFTNELRTSKWGERVDLDVESADLSGVAGTPSFFVNGQRQAGAYDIATLSRIVRAARARAAILD
jgi:Na+/H+ antiporter NhaA